MASRKMHLDGKPTGLSPADLPLFAEPVAYLTTTCPFGPTRRVILDSITSLLGSDA